MTYQEMEDLLMPYVKRYAITHQNMIWEHLSKDDNDERWDEISAIVHDFWTWIEKGALREVFIGQSKREFVEAVYDNLCRIVRELKE